MISLIRILLLILIFTGAGCQRSENGGNQPDLARELERTFEQLKTTLSEMADKPSQMKDLTSDEIEKLFNFEYLVVDLPAKMPSPDLEKKLNQLGEERWDCFQIERLETKIAISCKRRPKTYLRYIPRWF
jgi:hypothetical protein